MFSLLQVYQELPKPGEANTRKLAVFRTLNTLAGTSTANYINYGAEIQGRNLKQSVDCATGSKLQTNYKFCMRGREYLGKMMLTIFLAEKTSTYRLPMYVLFLAKHISNEPMEPNNT